tara:strand:- start:1646 stop:2266 length:621 start_codon:yes stop_codon:yes gene_type:complete
MHKGTLFIISAPSGAGKTSLIRCAIKGLDNVSVSISHTTRLPRPSESDGINYHFISKLEFDAMAKRSEFLEYAEVHGNCYGTSRDSVEKILFKGRDIVLEIDWQGANQVRGIFDNCCSVFILPPSKDELQRRLIKRGQDNENIIKKRLSAAQEEMKHYKEADFIIVNDDFQTSCSRLKAILGKHTECIATNTEDSQFNVLLSNLLS